MLVLVLTQNNHLNSSDYDCHVQADDGGDGDDGADVLLRYGEVFAQLSPTWVHTCKKRVMLRRRLFWPKRICRKSA